MTGDQLRGHPISLGPDGWNYDDTGEATDKAWSVRACGKCGLSFTPEGHDGCLGEIPGVLNACCGHGSEREAYVQREDGEELRGAEAAEWFKARGIGR